MSRLHQSEAGITAPLAARVAAAQPLADPAAVAAARAGLLDWLAAALAGRHEAGVRALWGVLARSGGAPTATVLGLGARTDPHTAALVNGYLGHALDYDDVHASARGHPSAVLLPALLALAEARGSSGAEFLAAYIVGVEVMCRLGLAIGPRHYEQGWHSTATLGAVAAAAACARLLGLGAEGVAQALGLAATQAGGLRVHFGSAAKPLHAGLAARAGLLAAELAAAGLQGAPAALDGPHGFFSAFAGGAARPERALAGWGEPWQIHTPGLWFKLYPCCSAALHAADAALALHARHRLAPGEIASVTVTFPPGGDAALTVRRPETGLAGRFSVEYVVAAALADGCLGLSTFADRPIRPDLLALTERVQRHCDAGIAPAPEAMPPGRFSIVTVRTTGGAVYSQRVDCPRGAPGAPLSPAERLAKLRDAAQGTPVAVDRLLALVDQLETLPSLSPLIAALQEGSPDAVARDRHGHAPQSLRHGGDAGDLV